MDVHIPDLHRCETPLWDWPTESRTPKEPLVASQQGHRGCGQSFGTWHLARGQQVPPQRLGKSWTGKGSVEEGREAGESNGQNK